MATSIIKPVHAGIKQSFTLPTTAASWTAVTGGYKYTWTSSLVTEGCRVKVVFASTNTNNTTPYIEYEKTSGGGGIDFIVSSVPTTAIPVVATIICAQTGNTIDVKDTDVSTSTNISALGANVNEALSSLNSNIANKIDIGKALSVPKNVATPINANEYISSGVYYCNDSSYNMPANSQYAILIVFAISDSYLWQIWLGAYGFFMRHYTTGSWSNWAEIKSI